MCTVNISEYDAFNMEEITGNMSEIASTSVNSARIFDNAQRFCKRCGCEEVQVSLRNKNEYCKTCFLIMSTHKFRATLGKFKLMQPNDSVLIAHSGKANSTVLLHLIRTAGNESMPKRFQFQFKGLYIDDGMVKGRTVEEREFIRNALVKETESLPLTMYIVSLSKCINDDIREEIQLINNSRIRMTSEDARLQEIFGSLENDTARDELLQQLRRNLFVSVARKLNCNKVFIADTSVDLAIRVLGDVSTGRGSQLPFNVAFSDIRYKDVMLLRPLRDFTGDDIAAYLNICKLYPILSFQKSNSSFLASIRNVATSFVHKLNSEFSSTVSTIYRTSEKLTTKVEEFDNANVNMNVDANIDVNKTCILCKLTVDVCCTSDKQLSVAQAKLFSKSVCMVADYSLDMSSLNLCEQSNNEETESIDTLKRKTCKCHSNVCNTLQRQSIKYEEYLCYSCKLVFLDTKQMGTNLPNFILNAIQKRLQLASLRKEITDFLL